MDGFLNNPTSVKFFRLVCDPDPCSEVQRALKCYEMCCDILFNNLTVNDEERKQLVELCPTYRWENEFDAAVVSNNDEELQKFFGNLKDECKFIIENTIDYYAYKAFIVSHVIYKKKTYECNINKN